MFASQVNRANDCWIPNETFEISNIAHSLMMTRGVRCNQKHPITFICTLDWSHRAFHRLTHSTPWREDGKLVRRTGYHTVPHDEQMESPCEKPVNTQYHMTSRWKVCAENRLTHSTTWREDGKSVRRTGYHRVPHGGQMESLCEEPVTTGGGVQSLVRNFQSVAEISKQNQFCVPHSIPAFTAGKVASWPAWRTTTAPAIFASSS